MLTFSPEGAAVGFVEGYIIASAFDATDQLLNSGSSCIDWDQVNDAGMIGGILGGLGAGIGVAPGEGACFSGETLVATESGEKPIEDVAVGEKVWSKDADGGELELRPVTRRFITAKQELLDLEIVADDGRDEIFRATATHRFWVEGAGWTVAGDLRAGDVVELRSGKQAVFERAERETKRATVYNLEVEGDHTYFVGDEGVWVHNGCGTGSLTRRIATAGDAQFPSQADALAEALERHGIDPSGVDTTPMYGKNSNLVGPQGQPWEIVSGLNADGEIVDFEHHSNGHSFADDGTYELPHYHGPDGEHLTYGK